MWKSGQIPLRGPQAGRLEVDQQRVCVRAQNVPADGSCQPSRCSWYSHKVTVRPEWKCGPGLTSVEGRGLAPCVHNRAARSGASVSSGSTAATASNHSRACV